MFSRSDERLRWGGEREGSNNGDDVLVEYCDAGYTFATDALTPDGAPTITEEVACDGKKADVWSIELDEPTTLEIAVDTVSLDTAFDPRLHIIDEDSCMVVSADDVFDCSYPPPRYRCPAIEYTFEPGEYRLVVDGFPNSCVEDKDEGEYKLLIGSDTPVRATLEEDDIYRFEQIPTEDRYSGRGELIFE